MKTTLLFLCPFFLTFPVYAERPSRRAEHRESAPAPRLAVLSLKEATQLAVTNNPSIQAVRARWEMMKARIPQAASWDDPMVGVDFERSGTTRLNTFTDAEWMVSQKLPIAGKNRSRARAASALAFGTLEELRRQQLDVVAKVRAAYFRLLNADAQIEVNRRNESLLTQFTEISRAKYEVGTQTQTGVLLADTERIRLLENRRDLERDLSDAQTQLNVLMNRPASAPLGRAVEVELRDQSWEPRTLEALALKNRPELQLAEQRIVAEQPAAGSGQARLDSGAGAAHRGTLVQGRRQEPPGV